MTPCTELSDSPGLSIQTADPESAQTPRTFRHTKTGGIYELVGDARLQASTSLSDMADMVVYRGQDGALWVRPREEFAQRFEPADLGTAAGGRTPGAAWRSAGESDPHAGHYDGERAALCMGNLTDDELAHGAFMNYDQPLNVSGILAGTHNSPIAWMTAVKDRIRWLSRALEKQTSRAAMPVIYVDDTGKLVSRVSGEQVESVLGPVVDEIRARMARQGRHPDGEFVQDPGRDHAAPREPLWDRNGNVIHAAVDRLGAAQRAAAAGSELDGQDLEPEAPRP